MSRTQVSILGGAVGGFVLPQLALAAGAPQLIFFLPFLPIVGLVVALAVISGSTYTAKPGAVATIGISAGALMGMGMWFIAAGFLLSGLIDLAFGLYWSLKLS